MNALLAYLMQWLRRWWPLRERAARPGPTPPPRLAGAAAPALPAPLVACASVVIPALNEARRIADVVRYVLSDPATAEVIVVDDSSIDDTAALAARAGAQVITSTMLGKGASMRDGLLIAQCALVVYLDGDLAGLRPGVVSALCRPLVDDEADFVKARFGRAGGRVTELTAKPMLKVFFPELARFAQPLGGIVAGRTALLRSLEFEDAYGVDIGLLIDAHRAGARLAEVDIGSLEHDSQPLLDLTAMANEVSRVIYARARAVGRLHVEQVSAMYETQRQATATIEYILTRRRQRTRLLLLDMDGTVTPGRYVQALAHATHLERALAGLLDNANVDASTRSERIAALFKFIHRRQFEAVAHAIEIRPGVVECVNRMRRAGFMVGLVSDSYFVAAEIVRRRIFADFALAHTLQFEGDVCTGDLRINPAFLPAHPQRGPALCKSHVLRRFRDDDAQPALAEVWAVGDNLNDLAMLRAADRAFVIEPKSPTLARDAAAVTLARFHDLSAQLVTAGVPGST
ncbi:MAG: glycosyltransferase [Burkholderiales bacterium]|nr:glycosyltransferase [Burkholderiales bacterium]